MCFLDIRLNYNMYFEQLLQLAESKMLFAVLDSE